MVNFIDLEKKGEHAILVQLHLHDTTPKAFNDALLEFKELSLSAGVTILDIITGKTPHPHPKYFMGSGKADEIAQHVKSQNADVVLVNHELTPGQSRNLEQLFECRVLDRTELILDIFSLRARTFEGKLQVELAQLEHLRTRLVRGWTHLERQKGGIGLRGPGETQLETDKRLIEERIKTIKKRLQKVEKQRAQNRRARDRNQVPLIAFVGYTNAGKSTLFNQLTSASVYVADQLFATLDPTLRYLELPQLGGAAFADTVGFVSQLPHELIDAFKATLEETRMADLLLHVVDASSENKNQITDDVEKVLGDIGAIDMPRLLVMNKIDLLPNIQPHIDYDQAGLPKRVWLSAIKNQGLELLREAIITLLTKRMVYCQVRLQPDQGRLRAKLYALGVVQQEQIDDQGQCLLDLAIQQMDFERLFREAH